MRRGACAVPVNAMRPLTVLLPGSGGGASGCPDPPQPAMIMAIAHTTAPPRVRNDMSSVSVGGQVAAGLRR
jgi:hypothetical protein